MKIKFNLFLKSFLLSFAAFALVACIILASLYINAVSIEPEKEETTVLLGIADKEKLLSLTVINFDPSSTKISFLPIPDNTLLESNTLLQATYPTASVDTALESIELIIGAEIDRYAILSVDALAYAVNEMGGFEYLIPNKFVYNGKLYSGPERNMNGDLARAMFTYKGYDMKKVSISDMGLSFLYSFLSKFANSSYTYKMGEVLTSDTMLRLIDTDLSDKELLAYCSLLSRYSSYSINEIKLMGTYHDEASSSIYFTPNNYNSDKNIFK